MQNTFIFVSKGRAILFLIRSIFVIFYLSLTLVISAPPEHLAIYLCMYMAVDIFLFNKMNYLNISVAFNFPWLMVLLFGMLDISTYTKNISTETIHACAVAIFSFSIFSYGKNIGNSISITKEVISKQWMFLLLFIFLLFSAFNIISAGYIPFVRMVLTGDSGYKDFGISGIYGLFLAFSNALGLVYI
ncbi:hypothetical protein WCU76_06545 [Pectobacterium versatile]|uniref:hypothetical protein n=1 Tax=Pectobacterium versatile TaxID=2488639 RepID=UPI00301712F0